MMKVHRWWLLAALVAGIGASVSYAERIALPIPNAADLKDLRPIYGANTVLALYQVGGTWNANLSLILAIWPDGHAVWSKDRLSGGPPYYEGEIEPQSVTKMVAWLKKDGLFAHRSLRETHIGVDAPYTTILIKSGKQVLQMESSHEIFEANGKNVGTKDGVALLDGEHRLNELRKQPASYLFYRLVWSETRSRLIDLLPPSGKPSGGKLIFAVPGRVYWQDGVFKEPQTGDTGSTAM
jgi:hypothetical protein